MINMNIKIVLQIAVLSFAGVLSGCFEDEPKEVTTALPDVNDENCKPDAIKAMTPKEVQVAFSSLCARRGNTVKSSPNKEW